MKLTKLLFLMAALIAVLALPSRAAAQKGEAVFGVQTGYTSTNESAIAGLFFQYGLTENLRIAPELGCVFRHKDLDAFTADINVQFPLRLGTNQGELYPLAGLAVASWTHHHVIPDMDDVSTRSTKVGANVGAGFQFNASPTLKIKIEAKYTIVSKYSTFVAAVGLGYIF
ncbi:MAG: porin family protein [Bacteroidales bacterium]|nr:porin family protein [Bacteroidales bacterium]